MLSEGSGFEKRQLAAHWSGKQSYLKVTVNVCDTKSGFRSLKAEL